MELNVLEESKTKLVFELKGETHTFCNLLKEELRKVSDVKTSAYKIDHPLVGVPKFMIETKSKSPRDAIKEALKNIKKLAKDFKKFADKL
jgi:DNA-directed RNA polymerase subunit L